MLQPCCCRPAGGVACRSDGVEAAAWVSDTCNYVYCTIYGAHPAASGRKALEHFVAARYSPWKGTHDSHCSGGSCRRMLLRWGFAIMKTRSRRPPLTNGDACCLPPAGTVRVTPRGVYHVCNPFSWTGFRCTRPVRESHPLRASHIRVCTYDGNNSTSPSAASHARKPTGLRCRSQNSASRASSA